MIVNKYSDNKNWVSPRNSDIKLLYSQMNPFNLEKKNHNVELIREIDFNNLIDDELYIQNLPESMMDRTEIDNWVTIRRMCWRVSPAPVRLLTQFCDNAFDLWSMNRTNIVQELEKNEFYDIIHNYNMYYKSGWHMFLSNFQESRFFYDTIKYEMDVLKQCIKVVKMKKRI